MPDARTRRVAEAIQSLILLQGARTRLANSTGPDRDASLAMASGSVDRALDALATALDAALATALDAALAPAVISGEVPVDPPSNAPAAVRVDHPFGPAGAPNLDDFSRDPADFAAAARVFERYAEYCRCKRDAIEDRASGRVGMAENQELRCETIYDNLPGWAQW